MPLRTGVVLETLGDLFFPRHCAGCAVAIRSGWLCGDCSDLLIAVEPPRCETCSRPYSGSLESFVCSNCRGKAFHFRHAVAVMQSRGVVRELIHRVMAALPLCASSPATNANSRGETSGSSSGSRGHVVRRAASLASIP